MKVAVYKADWHDVKAGGESFVKFKAGVAYPITEETQRHINQAHAEETEVPDLTKAQAAAKKAIEAAERAKAKADEAQASLKLAEEAQQIADAARLEAEEEARLEAEAEAQRLADEEAQRHIRAQNPGENMYQPPRQVEGPTREDLEKALAELPGSNTDPEYVVGAMRSFFKELFTADDEARVRDVVKAPPPAGGGETKS